MAIQDVMRSVVRRASTPHILLLIITFWLANANEIWGQGTPTTVTGSVGFDLPAGAKVWTSIPVLRPMAFKGRIQAVSGNTLAVTSTPNWLPGQFVYSASSQHNHYYALVGPNFAPLAGSLTLTAQQKTVTGLGTTFGDDVRAGDGLIVGDQTYIVVKTPSLISLTLDRPYSGASGSSVSAVYSHSVREGRAYAITSNDTASLTVDAAGDDLSVLAPGTIVSVVPYWTLGTVFPATDAGNSFIPRTAGTKGTKVQVTATASESIGTPSKATYFFLNGAWRQSGHASTEVHDDDVLAPDTFFTVKNPPGPSTQLRLSGVVLMNRMCIPLATDSDASVDNAAALLRPVPVSLAALGLLANHAFVKTKADAPGDRVVLQTISSDGKPVLTSFYFQKFWHQDGGDPTADAGGTLIAPGTGIIISKEPQPSGIDLWLNPAAYSLTSDE